MLQYFVINMSFESILGTMENSFTIKIYVMVIAGPLIHQ